MNKFQITYWEDTDIGMVVPSVSFPLNIARLVLAAGSNRDLNSIHHNTIFAQSTGAPDMYANIIFLYGMWERTIREFIGLQGKIKQVKNFKMKKFNTIGSTVVVKGVVKDKYIAGDEALVE